VRDTRPVHMTLAAPVAVEVSADHPGPEQHSGTLCAMLPPRGKLRPGLSIFRCN
jgi:hypothetical protein